MNNTVSRVKQKGRTRVMIVDPEWQFGLELADCLATGGYQAILVRTLESMIDDLGELQPGAILLRADSYGDQLKDEGDETIETVKALCPQAPMLMLSKSDHDTVLAVPQHTIQGQPPFIPSTGVEELLQSTLGIPCARVL
jgi:DNA-binding NarL/FixJ family response regulator